MTTTLLSRQCANCMRLRDARNRRLRWNCDAYPNGIPLAIAKEMHDHSIPYPGDHGILFSDSNQALHKLKMVLLPSRSA
jgi:hypothetical protein